MQHRVRNGRCSVSLALPPVRGNERAHSHRPCNSAQAFTTSPSSLSTLPRLHAITPLLSLRTDQLALLTYYTCNHYNPNLSRAPPLHIRSSVPAAPQRRVVSRGSAAQKELRSAVALYIFEHRHIDLLVVTTRVCHNRTRSRSRSGTGPEAVLTTIFHTT